jgi:hypothetical protein
MKKKYLLELSESTCTSSSLLAQEQRHRPRKIARLLPLGGHLRKQVAVLSA